MKAQYRLFFLVTAVTLGLTTSSFAQKREALTLGMTLDQSMKVAIDCVRKSSGFKITSDKRNIRLYRAEDTLELLGVTKDIHTWALKRCIVRNEEYGTQSVSIPDQLGGDYRRYYHYLTTRTSLDEVDSSWTLLKLAQHLTSTSGIAMMPRSSALSILSDCRTYGTDGVPVNPPEPPPAQPLLTARINENLPTGADAQEKADKFAKCVVSSPRYGIASVKFESPEGDSIPYFLEVVRSGQEPDGDLRDAETAVFISRVITDGNWTFSCLANFISKNSQPPLSSKSLAAEIALSALGKQLQKTTVSCPIAGNIANRCTKAVGYTEDTPIGTVLVAGSLQALRDDLRANLAPSALAIDAGCSVPAAVAGKEFTFFPKVDKRDQEFLKANASIVTKRVGGDPFDFTDVTDTTTVRDLIDKVRAKLIW